MEDLPINRREVRGGGASPVGGDHVSMQVSPRDCSHPPPKMATVENPIPGEAGVYHVPGHGSL